MNDVIVKVENLCKTLAKKTILDNINMEINRGTILGYLGPNGSGKTTTIRILLGLLRPTKGFVSIFDQTPEQMLPETRAKIGVVLDDHGLFGDLTAYQNLEYYSQIYRIPVKTYKLRIQECLEYVGMAEFSMEKIKTFSKGMKQRVALARCLLNIPEVIFLDEPTSGLDPDATVKVRVLMQELVKNEQITIFLNSHDLDEVERIATKIAILNRGEIIAQGSIEELKKRLNKSVVEIQLLNHASFLGIEDSIRNLPFVSNLKMLEKHILNVEILEDKYQSELVNFCIKLSLPVYKVNQVGSRLEDIYLSIVKDAEKNVA